MNLTTSFTALSLHGNSRMTSQTAWRSRTGALLLTLAACGWLGGASVARAAEPACPPQAAMPTQGEMVTGMMQAQDRGYLWRVERNGKTSWLYGTIHVAKADWMYPGPQILDALRQSDHLVVELNMLDPKVGQELVRLFSQPAGTPALPAALESRLSKLEDDACVPAAVRKWRPEMRLATLSVMVLRDQGLDAAYGVDGFLTGLATGLHKPVDALETPQSQADALLEKDDKLRVQGVSEGLDDIESGRSRRSTLRLAEDWAKADWKDLESYPTWCECQNTPRERAELKALLDDRNGPMVERIVALQRKHGSVFVAVGALHMVGAQGLPAKLSARGFKVTRVIWGANATAHEVDKATAPAGQASGAESHVSAQSVSDQEIR